MAQGLRIFDERGNIIVDTNDRMPRLLGKVYAISSGQFYVPEFSQGRPWFVGIVDWGNMFAGKYSDPYGGYATPSIEGAFFKWSLLMEKDRHYYATWFYYGVY